MENAMEMLRAQNQQLANHANGQLYAGLAALVEFDGYYLESEPCLVCNNPEVAYSQLKLSGVKVRDSGTGSGGERRADCQQVSSDIGWFTALD